MWTHVTLFKTLSMVLPISLGVNDKAVKITYKDLYQLVYHYLFFKTLINLFIYFWLHWVFIAVHGLSLVAVSGDYSLSWCAGFSLQWLLLLQSTGSRHEGFSSCGLRALERRLSSCGAWAYLLHGMWELSGPGLESMSPALAGRFLTTAPQGKPLLLPLYLPLLTQCLCPSFPTTLSSLFSHLGILCWQLSWPRMYSSKIVTLLFPHIT